ncbi:MAG: LLM class flavin-dependent oxidoreductase [Candidatus Helarchaeota archaeon]
MDYKELKIGTEGSFFPPFDKGINTIKRLEEAGYDSIWFADHLMSWIPDSIWTPDIVKLANYQETPHFYFDAISTISAAACSTNKIQLGTAVTETFRRHPAVISQTFLTLDHISKGRIILGIGAGEGENVVPYGIEWTKPASRLEEAIQIIRLLWENDQKIDFNGKFWKLKDAILGLKPYKEGKFPPIWIGAMGPKMLEITGRLGDGWLPVNLDLNSYEKSINIIKKSAKKAGRSLDEITPALGAYLIIDEDSNECHDMADTPMAKNFLLIAPNESFKRYGVESHPLGENFYGLLEYIPTRFDREAVLNALNKVPTKMCEECFLVGSPDEVIGKLEKFMKLGMKHIIFFNITYYCNIDKTKSSFNCMKKVLNYFKG